MRKEKYISARESDALGRKTAEQQLDYWTL